MFRDDERVCCVILIHPQQFFIIIPIDVRLHCFRSGFLGFIASIAYTYMYIDSIVDTFNIASKEEVRVFLFIHDQGGVELLAKICIRECAIVAVRLDIMYVVPGLVNQVILESYPNTGHSHTSSFAA